MSVRREGDLHRLWEIIKDIRFPVMTTRQSRDGLHSRPVAMCSQDAGSLEFLWFLIPKSSETAEDILWDSAVSLIFVGQERRSYVAVFGSAVSIEDTSLKRRFWSFMQDGFPDVQSWFPRDVGDSSVALVRLKVIRADCWNTEQNTVTHLFSLPIPGGDYDSSPQSGGNGPVHV